MKEVLYRQLAATIHECRTWVDVLDTDRECNFMLHSGGGLHPVRCRVLSLVARTAHGAYPKGHVWDIPEYRLDRAVNSLKRAAGLQGTLQAGHAFHAGRGGHHPPRLAQTHQLGT